ncbi:hypothetical protein GE061_007404 [Apolygus lucorum]|uniref:Peptidase S1 domain-containing protein n=1 Tax=Apolygus lucorum TaxID=248454 RepID=A0A8S9WTH8_APOLU|nr:hypothetical protein GE061_007404 [Apolygus lucorum]
MFWGSCLAETVKANPGDYPYFGTLLLRSRGICGATLFTPIRALTSCYCLMEEKPKEFKAPHKLHEPRRLELDMGNEGPRPTGQSRFGKLVKVHPKCERTARFFKYDYGVIEYADEDRHLCDLPDYSGPLICPKDGDSTKKVIVGTLTGRNGPYCTRTWAGSKVDEIFARLDTPLEWIKAEFPDPDPTTTTTTVAPTTKPSPGPTPPGPTPPSPTPPPSPAPTTDIVYGL